MASNRLFHLKMIGVGLVVIGAWLIWSQPARAGLNLSKQEIAALIRGEIVRKPIEAGGESGKLGGVAYALVDASPEDVYKSVEDVSEWPQIFPNTYRAKVIRSEGNAKSVELEVGVSVFQTKLHTIAMFRQEKGRIHIRLNESKANFADAASADLRLLSQPGGKTLVVYLVETRVPMLKIIRILGDDIVQRMQRALLDVPRRLKVWVERSEMVEDEDSLAAT